MAALDLEAEYNNRARVPEHADIFARWTRDAAAYRDETKAAKRADLGLRYGTSARQTIDLFRPANGGTSGLALFIHGGYWRSLEPSQFSHVARGLNARGVTVAVAGYDLCPQVTIGEIIAQLHTACAFLWRHSHRRFLVLGHSAGGHLSACMVGTNWTKFDNEMPADMTPVGMAISGLFDLEPLVSVSMNADLSLDPAEARRVSPVHWPIGVGRTFDAVVGGDESSEFLRQSKLIADTWATRGAKTLYQEMGGTNHFTTVDPLADSTSPMVARLATLAKRLS
jgi:arylformamidase